MNREQAETLLAQLVFDELEEPLRSELVAYLQTDAELAERVGDMRLTAKLLREGIEAEGEPALSPQHRAALERKAAQHDTQRSWRHRVLSLSGPDTARRVALLAACLALCVTAIALFFPKRGPELSYVRLEHAPDSYDYPHRLDSWDQATPIQRPEPPSSSVDARSRKVPEHGQNTTRGYFRSLPQSGQHAADAQLGTEPRHGGRDQALVLRGGGQDAHPWSGRSPAGEAGSSFYGMDEATQRVAAARAKLSDDQGLALETPTPSQTDWTHLSKIPGRMNVNTADAETLARTPGDTTPMKKLADADGDGFEDERWRMAPEVPSSTDDDKRYVYFMGVRVVQSPEDLPDDSIRMGTGTWDGVTVTNGKLGADEAARLAATKAVAEEAAANNTAEQEALRRADLFDQARKLNAQKAQMERAQPANRPKQVVDGPNERTDGKHRDDTTDTQTYDIRDLLVQTPDFSNAPSFDLNEALSNTSSGEDDLASTNVGGMFGGDAGDVHEDAPSRGELIEQIVSLIKETNDSTERQFDEETDIQELNGNLMIEGTASEHRRIKAQLAELRDARGLPQERDKRLHHDGLDPLTIAQTDAKSVDRWSKEPGEPPVAEPLPQVAMQMEQMAQLKAVVEELAVAVEDPQVLLHEAGARMDAGDYRGARRMLDEAGDYLPEDKLPRSSRESEALEEVQESTERLQMTELDKASADRLARGLAVMTKRLELIERARPQEEVQKLQQQAQAVEKLQEAELDELEKKPEPVIRAGDRLALSIFPVFDMNDEEAWQATVDQRGWIAVPGKGKLNVMGMTPSQVEQAVARAKASDVLSNIGPLPDSFGYDTTISLTSVQAAVVIVRESGEQDEPPQAEPEFEAEDPQPPAARKPRLMPVNPWVMAERDRLSTFALDVDTASLGIARRHIRQGFLPPRHTVRMEEFVNAFDYQYPAGRDNNEAFAVHAEAGPSPFARDNHTVLMKIGVRGKVVGRDQAKPAHLVFVVDTSGSMDRDDRLPLVKKSLRMLLGQLAEHDRVSVISYGTASRLLIENESAGAKLSILNKLDQLQIGGSTNLFSGVRLGYDIAQRHFITGGVNRVILCSDGVANVGPDQATTLVEQVTRFRGQGVTFTSVGVGAGSYDDKILEDLANKGDGSYLYIGSEDEARRLLVEDMAATRPTIAFDAKIQVDFDPQRVRRYRLIGYENRDIADRDFRNDAIDAGEVGSGQSATALYELELHGPVFDDALAGELADLGAVFVRYRDADTRQVREIQSRLASDLIVRRTPGDDPRFYLAASAAHVAEVLRGSEHVADQDINGNLARAQRVLEEVSAALPLDRRVADLLEMTRRAQGLPRAE